MGCECRPHHIVSQQAVQRASEEQYIERGGETRHTYYAAASTSRQMAEVLMEFEPELRQQNTSLFSLHHTDISAITYGQQDARRRIPNAYDHMTSEQIAPLAIIATQEALTPDALASCLLSMDPNTRGWFMSLLAAYHNQSDNYCSVLDSGSSRHLVDMMCIIDYGDKTPLAGHYRKGYYSSSPS